MKCSECKGACCETIVMEIFFNPPNVDASNWLRLHAVGTRHGGTHVELESCCRMLDKASGQCIIYESRPIICEAYVAGGPDCLETVSRRRTPEEYQKIRDDDDPLELPTIKSFLDEVE